MDTIIEDTIIENALEILDDMGALFGDVEDMGQMDAADFKDNAGEIWDLRQRAKKFVAAFERRTEE